MKRLSIKYLKLGRIRNRNSIKSNKAMKAKTFKHQNVVFAENQPEYTPLPALKIKSNHGEVIFCMGLSFTERIRVLLFGEIWVSLMTFNNALTPSFHSTNRKDVYFHTDDNINQFRRFIDLGAIIYFSQKL